MPFFARPEFPARRVGAQQRDGCALKGDATALVVRVRVGRWREKERESERERMRERERERERISETE